MRDDDWVVRNPRTDPEHPHRYMLILKGMEEEQARFFETDYAAVEDARYPGEYVSGVAIVDLDTDEVSEVLYEVKVKCWTTKSTAYLCGLDVEEDDDD